MGRPTLRGARKDCVAGLSEFIQCRYVDPYNDASDWPWEARELGGARVG